MSEPKPFASLSPGLLARKGSARPAMRPQLQPLSFEEQNRLVFGSRNAAASATPAVTEDDLGWNDMGWDDTDRDGGSAEQAAPATRLPAAAPAEVVAITPEPVTAADDDAPEPARPEVLRQIESITDKLSPMPAPGVGTAQVASLASARAARRGSALKEGRKAAFTLRLDAERHLRLRLACTLENRSAQQVVTEALDRFLDEMTGLEDLARRARRS